MTIKNTAQTYGWVSKWLHWFIGIGIIGMIIMGFCLHELPPSNQYFFIQVHKSIGTCILFLMIIRLIWRQMNITPALPKQTPRWQRFLAKTLHLLLYLCAILMPISGWAMTATAGYAIHWFFLFHITTPFIAKNSALAHTFWQIHSITAWLISILIVLHTLAALKHHFIDKDTVLKRMLPG